jgi:hypothetical protein
MALQLIGYWKVTLRDSYPFPQEVEFALEPDVREQLVRYLDAGIRLHQFRGFSSCRYGCGVNGSAELSDGVWLWPEGLAHYLREHRVGLPPEFLRHACRPGAAPLQGLTPRPSHEYEIDESLWTSWAKQYRRPALDHAILAALERVATRCEGALQARAEELQVKRGLADTTCLSAGCSRQATRGMAFCGWCLSEDDRARTAAVIEAEELANLLGRVPWNADA